MITSGIVIAHGPASGNVPEFPYVPDFLVVHCSDNKLWSIGREETEIAMIEKESITRLETIGRLKSYKVEFTQWTQDIWFIAESDIELSPFLRADEHIARTNLANKLLQRAYSEKDPSKVILLLDGASRIMNISLANLVKNLMEARQGHESLSQTFSRLKSK